MSDPNSTVTMYFCGSGNNMSEYKAKKHAVPYLISIARNLHMGFDGPGGNPSSKLVYKMNSNGTFYQNNSGDKLVVTHGKLKTKNPFLKLTGSLNSGTGGGTNANLMAAIDWLYSRFLSGKAITTINLCGHSRGSVTAIAFAWAIEALIKPSMPNIKVNMFLFDPVAGAKNEFLNSYNYEGRVFPVQYRRLPSCVKNFRGILAANMGGDLKKGGINLGPKDNGFASTMPWENNNTCDSFKVYVMPGGHNGATKYNVLDGGSSIGKVGLHLAQSFLKEHGSQFSVDHNMTWQQICEAYAESRVPKHVQNPQMNNLGAKQDLDKDFFGDNNKLKTSNLRHNLTAVYSDTAGHDYWVNDHHRTATQRAMPAIHRLICANSKVPKSMIDTMVGMPNSQFLIRRAGLADYGTGVQSNQAPNQFQM